MFLCYIKQFGFTLVCKNDQIITACLVATVVAKYCNVFFQNFGMHTYLNVYAYMHFSWKTLALYFRINNFTTVY